MDEWYDKWKEWNFPMATERLNFLHKLVSRMKDDLENNTNEMSALEKYLNGRQKAKL